MKVLWKSDRGAQLTVIGAAVMALLTLTKVVPSSTIAGYSVFVGIVFFFLVEAVEKTRGAQSGLRFSTLPADLRKKGVLFWMLMPLVSALLTAGDLFPISIRGFFPGRDEDGKPKFFEKCEPTHVMLIPLILLTALSILAGMFPSGLVELFSGQAGLVM